MNEHFFSFLFINMHAIFHRPFAYLSHLLITEILCCVHSLILNGSSVVFMWVSRHVGLAGNSAADSAAKDALLLPVSNLTVPLSDYKSLICLQALRQWQLHWNCETENKLHSIEPRVNVINKYSVCLDEMRLLFTD